MNYKILTLAQTDLWNNYLLKLPIEQQDVYFTPEYYSLYEANGDGEAKCFVFEKNGELALYPFFINSVNKLGYILDAEYFDIQGAYGYNGIVSSSKDASFIYLFWKELDLYCQGNNIIAEFTRFHPLLKNQNLGADHFNLILDRKTVYLGLDSPLEEIFNSFQRTTKRQIKNCTKKFNLSTRIIQEVSDEDIDIFASIYTDAMKRVDSSAYLFFEKAFFEKMLRMDNSVLFVAYHEDKPIAVISALLAGDYIHGHLGGGLTEYLYTYAYSILYYKMIEFGKSNKCKYLHVGGGRTSAVDDKLLSYKMHYSKNLSDFYIGKKIHNIDIYNQVVEQWKERYPESYNDHKVKLLGYREI